MVGAMEDPLRVRGNTAIPLDEIEVRASRSSGPGGQHANKTSSRIEASFDVTASQALTDAQDGRSQARNRELALQRLADRLSGALAVPRPRRATRPTQASVQRRLAEKRRRAQRKTQRRPPQDDP
jgi:ribosome-associated protein